MVGLAEVQEAAKRIEGKAHITPILTCATLDALTNGCNLFFKCENLQRVGAFKIRGACNAVFKLTDEEARKGVVTHSSGNHAQALALAAKLRGIPAYIVMPLSAPAVKKRGVLGYGAQVIDCPTVESRQPTADRIVAETGAVFIHPYNNPDVIAGQATIALEALEQVADLDAIITPVGGGGMMSGVAIAAKALKPGIKVFGAEPKDADDAYRSKEAGELLPQTGTSTIADGLRTGLGSLTWPVVRDLVDAIYTVSEEEIKAAMRLVWERMKLVVEPSGAVSLAAVLSEDFRKANPDVRRICVVFSGGNVDLDAWRW